MDLYQNGPMSQHTTTRRRQPVTWTFKTMLKQINRITEEKLGFSSHITIL
ncbi:MAG: hypothetical protein LBD03_07880 [Methanobrevibacter sp.]|nr:hypothetical protein [Candidatus Methanovirga procula]